MQDICSRKIAHPCTITANNYIQIMVVRGRNYSVVVVPKLVA